MKVLVTSASRKLPLLRSIAGQLAESLPSTRWDIVAGDADGSCLASYAWPHFWHMPRIDDSLAVIDAIVAGGFDLVIPTRDADVDYFSRFRDDLEADRVACLTPSTAAAAACLDKFEFAQLLSAAGLPAIPTYLDNGAVQLATGSVVLKERYGAGSVGQLVDVSIHAAASAAVHLVDPIFQPFVSGREFSIDAYRSRAGQVLGMVARTRDLVIGGESQVTTTVDPAPFAVMVDEVLRTLGFQGHALIQVIEASDGMHIIECNPRLGGASTLSLAAGLRSLAWFALEAQSLDPLSIPFQPRTGELRLIRTPQDEFRDLGI